MVDAVEGAFGPTLSFGVALRGKDGSFELSVESKGSLSRQGVIAAE